MINSDRRARMLLSCAMEGGDLAVTELVQNIGAEGAWAKIIEGVLGEPAASGRQPDQIDAVERLAKKTATRFVIPGERRVAEPGLMIFDMPNLSSDAAASRWGSGCAVPDISPTSWSGRSRLSGHGRQPRTETALRPISPPIWWNKE